MPVTRSTLAGGPGRIKYNPLAAGTAPIFFAKDDAKLDLELTTVDVESTSHGKIDEAVTDVIAKLSLTPVGAWENLGVLYQYLNPTIGTRIFGDADIPVILEAADGGFWTIVNGAITKLPSIHLGVDKTIFGPMEFTGLRKNNSDGTDDSSIYTFTSGNSYADATFNPAAILQQRYSAAWGSVTGFTSFQAQSGWDIDFDFKLEPVKVDGVGTVDMKIVGLQVTAKCMPVGPTGANVATALRVQNTGNSMGRRLGANGADLVITGSGCVVTLKQAALKTAGLVFGGKPLRNGEIAFVSTVGFSAGVPAASAVVATS